jgi:hypothetical protein
MVRKLVYFSIILLSLAYQSIAAFQRNALTKVLNIKKTFGAKGDGISDDTKCFSDAADYINKNKGNSILYIPKGIYRVGHQKKVFENKNIPLKTNNIFGITKCDNVLIYGDKNTSIIKYNDNLYFGSFTNNLQPLQEIEVKRPFSDQNTIADMGVCFILINCSNINIEKLSLDGNFTKGHVNIGGGCGDAGWQITHIGIYVVNTNQLKIESVNIKKFGEDGLYLWNNLVNVPNENLIILKSKFEQNGRQGISLCSGKNILIADCIFANTGKGILNSAPGAGIDFEPENTNGDSAFIENCDVKNCKMYNNSGPGVLLLNSSFSSHINFYNCTLVGNSYFCAWVTTKNVTFNNCNFFGTVVHNYGSDNESEATKYNNCFFADNYKTNIAAIANIENLPSNLYINNYLVSSNNTNNVIYNSCKFNTLNNKTLWLNATKKYKLINCSIVQAANINDGIWVPFMESQNSSFKFPEKSLQFGLNFKSGNSTLDSKTQINSAK